MEDRHTVSDPRPVDNSPSWAVDILRDNSVIVDTILLNNSTLPPRKNKRGKVLWRLPDSLDRTPAFGTDDRRRILDIHKERKKKRKQEKKKRGSTASLDSDRLDSTSTINSSTATPPVQQITSDKGGVSNGTPIRRGKYDRQNKTKSTTTIVEDITKKKGKENGKISDDRTKAQDDNSPENGGGGKVQKKKKKNAASQWRANRGGSFSSKEKELSQTNGGAHSSSTTTSQQQLPGLDLPTSTQSSNGNNHESSSVDQFEEQTAQFTQMYPEALGSSDIPDPSCISLEEAKAEVSKSSEVTTTLPLTEEKPATLSSQTSVIQPPKPLPPSDALFIVVPKNERPESLPGQPDISIAVPTARHFISKYYAHFDGTLPGAQIGDLIRYYTTKAQKSVSIGGAHSVVTGRKDIAAQIQSLAGAAFVVRGVVAQDTADGKGVHILVTGTAGTGALGGVAVNFAHSVSLVPIEAPFSGANGNGDSIGLGLREALEIGFPFQIHNDALALLSGDVGPAAAPIPPQPMQNLPPSRPPGLF